MSNRMIMACYTVDIDCDQGFHYTLHIPDGDNYDDPFYDETLILNPNEINRVYKEGHKEADAVRKEKKLKAKDLTEECYFTKDKHSCQLKFVYYVGGELITTTKVDIPYPFDETAMTVSSIEDAYGACLDRVKVGGAALLFDLVRMDIIEKVANTPGLYNFMVRIGGKKIVVPLSRTLFLNTKKFDSVYLSVQETTLDDIYLFALSMTIKDVNENIWGYLIRY